MKEYPIKTISLNCNRRLINAVKKAGLETVHPQGSFNGYGYEKLPLAVVIHSIGEMRTFNKIKKKIELEETMHPHHVMTEEEKTTNWCKRLCKFTGISFEEAQDMAKRIKEYQAKHIELLVERQRENYSKRRESLIKQLRRSNPLRRIENAYHAFSILNAEERHMHSDYDYYLEMIHELEKEGRLHRGNATDLARQLTRGDITWEDLLDNL